MTKLVPKVIYNITFLCYDREESVCQTLMNCYAKSNRISSI